jgi:hypothetical protein
MRTLINPNARNITWLWLLLAFEKLPHLKAQISDNKHSPPYHSFSDMAAYHLAKVFVLVFQALKQTNLLFGMFLIVTQNAQIAESVWLRSKS